jgi:hypothetical protein
MMKKSRAHLTHLKRRKRLIEEFGYLQDCWIAKYQPAGTAKGKNTYYHLRSRLPQFNGKKSQHLKADEMVHYQKLIENGRELKRIERQLQKLTYRISQREAFTSNESNEWYTPPEYIELARDVMGNIDLDPASHSLPQTWIKASQTFTAKDNGLNHQWTGRVWLNPPYSSGLHYWIDKIITTYEQGHVSQAVLLLKPAVGSSWYQRLTADFPRCEPHKRIRFINAEGIPQKSPVHGNTFIYLGDNIPRFAEVFETIGNIACPLRLVL